MKENNNIIFDKTKMFEMSNNSPKNIWHNKRGQYKTKDILSRFSADTKTTQKLIEKSKLTEKEKEKIIEYFVKYKKEFLLDTKETEETFNKIFTKILLETEKTISDDLRKKKQSIFPNTLSTQTQKQIVKTYSQHVKQTIRNLEENNYTFERQLEPYYLSNNIIKDWSEQKFQNLIDKSLTNEDKELKEETKNKTLKLLLMLLITMLDDLYPTKILDENIDDIKINNFYRKWFLTKNEKDQKTILETNIQNKTITDFLVEEKIKTNCLELKNKIVSQYSNFAGLKGESYNMLGDNVFLKNDIKAFEKEYKKEILNIQQNNKENQFLFLECLFFSNNIRKTEHEYNLLTKMIMNLPENETISSASTFFMFNNIDLVGRKNIQTLFNNYNKKLEIQKIVKKYVNLKRPSININLHEIIDSKTKQKELKEIRKNYLEDVLNQKNEKQVTLEEILKLDCFGVYSYLFVSEMLGKNLLSMKEKNVYDFIKTKLDNRILQFKNNDAFREILNEYLYNFVIQKINDLNDCIPEAEKDIFVLEKNGKKHYVYRFKHVKKSTMSSELKSMMKSPLAEYSKEAFTFCGKQLNADNNLNKTQMLSLFEQYNENIFSFECCECQKINDNIKNKKLVSESQEKQIKEIIKNLDVPDNFNDLYSDMFEKIENVMLEIVGFITRKSRKKPELYHPVIEAVSSRTKSDQIKLATQTTKMELEGEKINKLLYDCIIKSSVKPENQIFVLVEKQESLLVEGFSALIREYEKEQKIAFNLDSI